MRTLLLAIAIAAIGCGNKTTEETPAGAAAAVPDPNVPAAPTAAAKAEAPVATATAPQIDCGKAIPKELIARYLAGSTSEFAEPFDNGDGSYVTSCRFVDEAAKGRTIVRYKCGPTFADVEKYLADVESQLKSDDGGPFKFTRIEGIGRAAFRDKHSIAAQHREMPCLIEVDEMGERETPDWTPLLKDLEAALTPAAAK
jgi:hypothetical protein